MNSDYLVAEAQLARRALLEHAPGLVALSRERWQSWVVHSGNDAVETGSRLRISIVCPLSMFEDLDAAVGLTQLLEIPCIDANIVFSLPTAPAARFYQKKARDRGFSQLVHVVTSEELPQVFDKLDYDTLVCFVPTFCLLTPDYLQDMQDVIERRHGAHGYVSRAGVIRAGGWRYRAGSRAKKGDRNPASSLLTSDLTKAPDTYQKSCASILDQFRMAAQQMTPTGPPCGKQPVQSLPWFADGPLLRLHYPVASSARELIVRTRTDASEAPRRILYRRAFGLLGRQSRINIEPPLESIGERPLPAEVLLRTESETLKLALSVHVPPSRLEPWMVTCYLNRGGGGNRMIRAFADGIGCGLRYAEDETGPCLGIPVVWGILRGSDRVVAYARQAGRYFFYIDHAYFSRGHGVNYRITRNAYEARRVRLCPPDRLANHGIVLKPWQTSGSSILVCPPTDYFMTAHNCHDWLERTLETLKLHTDRPVIVRLKPQPGTTVEPLEESLRKAHALVTHSSNVAIEAVIAGTPVFVSSNSAAAPVGATDLARIESPFRPDREAWLAHLAYSQFSFDEIRSGAAWRMLLEWEDRPFIDVAEA